MSPPQRPLQARAAIIGRPMSGATFIRACWRVRPAAYRCCRTVLATLLVACMDAPTVRPGAALLGVTTRRPSFATVGAAAAAGVTVPVQVPAAMRWRPFDVERQLTVPAGYAIAVHARVAGARFLAVAPNGDLLVSVPGEGRIARVRSVAGGGDPSVSDWLTGLRNPHDIVFHEIDGTTYVYVAESHQIDRFVYDAASGNAGARQVVVAGLPDNSSPELQGRHGHQLKNIALDGDRLYVSIASPSNADPADLAREPKGGAIYLYPAGGGAGRLYAQGLRNAEGLAIAPGTRTLWVAVNNRDNIAYPFHDDYDGDGSDDYGRVLPSYVDDHPPEAFTSVRDGGHYGWPFCNSNPDAPGGLVDMPFDRDVQTNADGSRLDCATADRVRLGIPAHSAPLGLTFWTGAAAPSEYRNGALVGLHGSWNRTAPAGYRVAFIPWNAGTEAPGPTRDLVSGWTNGGVWGRPVDVAIALDGALFISDDQSGTVYRLARVPTEPPPPAADAPARTNRLLVGAQSGRCVDVPGASHEPATSLIIWDCHGQDNQRWTLPAVGGSGAVRVYGDMCMDAGVAANGTRVRIQPCTGAAAQRWAATAAGELRAHSGRCLDAEGMRIENGAEVQVWDCHGGANQRWEVPGSSSPEPQPTPTPPPADPEPTPTLAMLVGVESGRCVDVPGAAREPGSRLHLWDCHGGENQRFSVPSAGASGPLRIYGSLCVQVDAGAAADGSVTIQTCTGAAAQRWTTTSSGELRSVDGRCLDVWEAGRDNGARLATWACHGGSNQRFVARP
jgi:glucose/arabinose dehydrogenase